MENISFGFQLFVSAIKIRNTGSEGNLRTRDQHESRLQGLLPTNMRNRRWFLHTKPFIRSTKKACDAASVISGAWQIFFRSEDDIKDKPFHIHTLYIHFALSLILHECEPLKKGWQNLKGSEAVLSRLFYGWRDPFFVKLSVEERITASPIRSTKDEGLDHHVQKWFRKQMWAL